MYRRIKARLSHYRSESKTTASFDQARIDYTSLVAIFLEGAHMYGSSSRIEPAPPVLRTPSPGILVGRWPSLANGTRDHLLDRDSAICQPLGMRGITNSPFTFLTWSSSAVPLCGSTAEPVSTANEPARHGLCCAQSAPARLAAGY